MDTLETIKCPACGKDMEKIFHYRRSIKRQNI